MSKSKRARTKPPEERETLTTIQRDELNAVCEKAIARAVHEHIKNPIVSPDNPGGHLSAARLCSGHLRARPVDYRASLEGLQAASVWQALPKAVQLQPPDVLMYALVANDHNAIAEALFFGDGEQSSARLVPLYRSDGAPNTTESESMTINEFLSGLSTDSRDGLLTAIRVMRDAWVPPSKRPALLAMEDLPYYLSVLPLYHPIKCVRQAWTIYRTFYKRAQLPYDEWSVQLRASIDSYISTVADRLDSTLESMWRIHFLDWPALLGHWAANSFPIYNLTTDFTAAMTLTDPLNLPVADLRFPHTAFCLRLPADFFVSNDDNSHEQQPEVVWVAIYRASLANLARVSAVESTNVSPLADWIAGLADPQYENAAWSNASWISIGVAGRTDHPSHYSVYTRMLLAGANGPGSTIAEDLIAAAGSLPDWLRSNADMEFLRLALNVGLYIAEKKAQQAETHPENEKSHVPHQSSPKRNAAGDPIPDVTVLDQTVKLDAETIALARRVARGEQKRAATYKLHGRIYVSGHYRHNQVCGSRKKLPDGRWTPWPSRRSVWIAPYTKHPEGDTITRHVYELGNKSPESSDISTHGTSKN